MHNIHSFHPLAIAINPYFQRINPSSTLHLQLASLHALSFPYIVESIVKKKKKKKTVFMILLLVPIMCMM